MNLREAFSKYPLERQQFDGEWIELWNALERVLAMPAFLEERLSNGRWYRTRYEPRLEWLLWSMLSGLYSTEQCRIVLLDDTVIREWGAK